ncbi:MAG: S-methyl-5-thioribose-1-phosphate isomerase [Deltaproteobacteria bacterium]
MKTIAYEAPYVVILDQNQLPQKVVYESCVTAEQVADAIRELKVRGAPLIGVAAAFGLALAMLQYHGSEDELLNYYQEKRDLLAATRPTAVNLFWALQRMDDVMQGSQDLSAATIALRLLQAAQELLEDDIRVNEAIGEKGQTLLSGSVRVMTICNAGALATCGYGTALGVIRSAARLGKIEQVWACETRPVLQGARLTVWELMEDGIPVTLISDNMAASVMRRGEVDAVLVGADRIAANGDTANKIGTYGLAVLAAYHRIPFYVVAPSSTVDISLASGEEIPIEERHGDEIRQFRGVYFTVPEAPVFNPAFDVTPNELITAIITEKSIIRPPFNGNMAEAFKTNLKKIAWQG